jgi:hypothetical protein
MRLRLHTAYMWLKVFCVSGRVEASPVVGAQAGTPRDLRRRPPDVCSSHAKGVGNRPQRAANVRRHRLCVRHARAETPHYIQLFCIGVVVSGSSRGKGETRVSQLWCLEGRRAHGAAAFPCLRRGVNRLALVLAKQHLSTDGPDHCFSEFSFSISNFSIFSLTFYKYRFVFLWW